MPTVRSPRPVASRVLDRYRLERRLGAGAFGAVWLAYDETLERRVAVKVVPRPERAEPDPRGRAQREALASARLNHPGIVALYEAGEDAEAHYLVSELVEGLTLAQAIAQSALSDRDALRVGVALCDALAHAHAHGVVHRDIKPANVIIPARPHSEAGLAKLTDFGVARLAGEDMLTRTGDVVGTLAYMAPEQAEGRRVGPPADVYALALVLYEVLAGFNPARAAAPAATARRVAAGLPSLRRARRDLAAGLVLAIDAGLRRRPEERGSLEALRAALTAALPDAAADGGARTLVAPADALMVREPRPLARRLGGRGLAGALAGGACFAALVALVARPPLEPLPAAAVVALAVALLPRLGWLVTAGAGVAWLAAGSPHQPGTAVVIAAGLLACPLLLARAGVWWSLPALAPALAALGLACAWPALAALAPRLHQRAALGALGAWWVALAEPLSGRELYLGQAATIAPSVAWIQSPRSTAVDALAPLATSGALAGAVLWALAAVALPWALRTRSTAVLVIGVLTWAAVLVVGSEILGGVLQGTVSRGDPRGALAGAAAGGLAAAGFWLARTRPHRIGRVGPGGPIRFP